MKKRDWGYRMNDEMDQIMKTLSKAYQDTYLSDRWDDMEEAEAEGPPKPRYDHAGMLRDVMHELHKQGDGLDTLLALKNDMLREWWNTELVKIKKEEAKRAAREKAKSLFSEEERKLLGMKF